MTTFDDVIREFQKRRIEKEIESDRVKNARMSKLQDLARMADQQMMKKRGRKRKNA